MIACDVMYSRVGGVIGVSSDNSSMLHYWKPGSWLMGDADDLRILSRKVADVKQLQRELLHLQQQQAARQQRSCSRAERTQLLQQQLAVEQDLYLSPPSSCHSLPPPFRKESLACNREALMLPWKRFLSVRPSTRLLLQHQQRELQAEALQLNCMQDTAIQFAEAKEEE